MTNILAHNSRGDAVVFTADGRLIGPHQTRPGDPADPLTARLLACGRLVKVSETEEPTPGMEAPAGNAAQAEWVEYAVTLGFDRADVEDLRRNELRDLLRGTDEPEAGEPGGGEPEQDQTEQADPVQDAGDADGPTGTDEPDKEATEPTGGAETDSEKETN